MAGAASVFLQLGDEVHQAVPGQQARAHQQDGLVAVQQGGAQGWQGALHQALQVGPVAAGALGGVGLQHHGPVHLHGLGLGAQFSQQQGIEVDALHGGKAALQLGIGMAGQARVHGEHEQAALL